MKYIFFDTETTGVLPEDRIIQVASLSFDATYYDSCLSANFLLDYKKHYELCKSDKMPSIESMEVNHITPEMLANKKYFIDTDFYKNLCELNSDENYLIAHNIDFDITMLKKEGFEPKYKLIDTYRCARHLFKDLAHHRLQYLRYALKLYLLEEQSAKQLQIDIKAHDAMGDVLILMLLFNEMLKVKNANELYLLSKEAIFIDELKFGKYKGLKLSDVAFKDRSYLDWLLKNSNDVDLLYSIKKVLQ